MSNFLTGCVFVGAAFTLLGELVLHAHGMSVAGITLVVVGLIATAINA